MSGALKTATGDRRECIHCHKEFAIEKFPIRHDQIRSLTCVYCKSDFKKGVYTWGDIPLIEEDGAANGEVDTIKQRLRARVSQRRIEGATW